MEIQVPYCSTKLVSLSRVKYDPGMTRSIKQANPNVNRNNGLNTKSLNFSAKDSNALKSILSPVAIEVRADEETGFYLWNNPLARIIRISSADDRESSMVIHPAESAYPRSKRPYTRWPFPHISQSRIVVAQS